MLDTNWIGSVSSIINSAHFDSSNNIVSCIRCIWHWFRNQTYWSGFLSWVWSMARSEKIGYCKWFPTTLESGFRCSVFRRLHSQSFSIWSKITNLRFRWNPKWNIYHRIEDEFLVFLKSMPHSRPVGKSQIENLVKLRHFLHHCSDWFCHWDWIRKSAEIEDCSNVFRGLFMIGSGFSYSTAGNSGHVRNTRPQKIWHPKRCARNSKQKR
jgi:hypothetical protein